MRRGDHDAAGTKIPSRTVREGDNAGHGSAGSWRAPNVDSTKLGHGDHGAADTKIGHKPPPLIARKRTNGNLKPMRFVSFHHHSTFSYLDGYQLPEAHVRRAEELQMSSFALTEHGNIDSHVRLERACEKSGVKPMFGCEVYMPAGPNWWLNEETQRKYHLTVIAKDQEGYLNLLQLITESWKNRYYEPTVSWDMLRRYKKGLLILSGCTGSLLFCSTVGGKNIEPGDASYKRGLRVARAFAKEFGHNYFIEVQAFPELQQTRDFNPLAALIARNIGRRLFATMDVHYTELDEAEVQQILHNLRPGEQRTLEEQVRDWGYDVPLCPPPSDRSIFRRLQLTGLSRDEAIEAIVSTEEVAQDCNVVLPRLPMVRFPLPAGFEDAISYWRHLLREGWYKRGIDKKPREYRRRAREQLAHEMELIEGKDFVDYHLLIASGIRMLKAQGVPVTSRGSAGASIACYLLGIIEGCPLDFPFLRFDRYISVDREDLPDIDLDIPGEARSMLRDFYESMLGPGRVNNVGTFTQFKGRNSIDDVQRVFKIPKLDVEHLKGYLIERSSGDLRASSTIEDTVEQFPAAKEIWDKYPELAKSGLLEGNIKGVGVHACGIILSREPITTVTTMMEKEVPRGSGNIIQAIPLDKKDAERQGLLKADFLGLNTMSMLWDCIRRLGMSLEELYGLPLDDPEVYQMFKENDVVGIFQFDGRANRYVSGAVQPERFSEIMDCIALCRPGPLHNGAAREYAEIKHGMKTAEAAHPAIEAITAPTKHQIIYQEQVLDIMSLVGNFDRVGVAEARRIIARKEGEQAFARKRAEFIKGARTVHERMEGVPPMKEATAGSLFGDLTTSGAYAFNAAHSAQYGMVSVWTGWMKVYHPDVFYAAALTVHKKNEERVHQLLRDADRHGVRVLPPDPARSEVGWRPVRRARQPRRMKPSVPTIQAGFEQIHGVGDRTADQIVAYRDEHGLPDWGSLVDIKGIGPKTVEKIEDWVKQDDPLGAFKLVKNINEVKADIKAGKLPVPMPTHTATDLPYEQGQEFEVIWLGTVVARNIRDIFEVNRARTGEELDASTVKDAHLNEWALLTAEDETDQLLLKVDRWKYPKLKTALFDFRLGHDLMLVIGVRPRYVSSRQIKIKKMYVIDPEG